MSQSAKIFMNGKSQAVRLPLAYRFDTKEVFIWKDEETGNVVLSRKPDTWDQFFKALENTSIPDDFLNPEERKQTSTNRNPLDGIV